MTTGFCDRDLPSQCRCIPAAFFVHASCHYLLAAYLFSFQCQLDAQYNLQPAFLNQRILLENSLIAFLSPALHELTLLKHLFYLSSRLIVNMFAATRRWFRTW